LPTHYDGTASERRALNTFITLLRAAESVSGRLIALVADQTGLTITQFGVLEALLHLGPMCQKDLATKQLKTGGNITLVVDNLEKRKLVRRVRSTEDRRMITVHLTPSGRKTISDYFPSHVAAIEHELSVLTAKEQEQLGFLTRKLGRQEGRSQVGVYPDACYVSRGVRSTRKRRSK
jgi:MarR family 2-MHQ and catechol resistance regulon transcriptional repressor